MIYTSIPSVSLLGKSIARFHALKNLRVLFDRGLHVKERVDHTMIKTFDGLSFMRGLAVMRGLATTDCDHCFLFHLYQGFRQQTHAYVLISASKWHPLHKEF